MPLHSFQKIFETTARTTPTFIVFMQCAPKSRPSLSSMTRAVASVTKTDDGTYQELQERGNEISTEIEALELSSAG